ncbi:MAG: hypothetical protein ACLRWM_07775 [Streptococcus sp.]
MVSANEENEPKNNTPSTEQVIEDSSSEDILKEDKYERWRKEALDLRNTNTAEMLTRKLKNALKEMCSYVETVQNVTDVKQIIKIT